MSRLRLLALVWCVCATARVEAADVPFAFGLDAAADPDPGSCTSSSSSSGADSPGAGADPGASSSSGGCSSSGASGSPGSSGNAGRGAGAGVGDGAPDTTAPAAPGSPRLTLVTSSSVALAWAPSSDDVGVAGYDVFQVSATGDTRIARTTVPEITLSRLAPSTAYAFNVRARDGAGNLSRASATLSVVTPIAATPSVAGGVGCTSAPSPGAGAGLLLVGVVALARRVRAAARRARAPACDRDRGGDDARRRGRAPQAGGSA